MWWITALALAGQTEPAMVCPDGEPVRPPKKVRVCEKPFRVWARNVELSVRANATTMAGGVSGGTEAIELSGDVAKALRTQASALCVGMMTAPCTVKDDYLPLVREMPDLLVRLEQAKTAPELLEALERARNLAEPDAPDAGAPPPAPEPEPEPCSESTFVLDGSNKQTVAVAEGRRRIIVDATGGGVDGSGVLLRWDAMRCSRTGGSPLPDAMSPAGLRHELDCDAPSTGDTLWVVNPQGGLLDGNPGRTEVKVQVCLEEGAP